MFQSKKNTINSRYVIPLLLSILSFLPVTLCGYKEEHQGFVKNFKGTSVGNILICLIHVPASILFLKIVQGSSPPSLIRDMFCLILPILLNMTVFADYCYFTIILMIAFEIIFILKINPYRVRKESDDVIHSGNVLKDNEPSSLFYKCKGLTYINLFKGANMLVTCIAILAVDFRIFPRRFAKTETFGISLMDIGVGTFIVSSAITSKYARGQYPPRMFSDGGKEENKSGGGGGGGGDGSGCEGTSENESERRCRNDIDNVNHNSNQNNDRVKVTNLKKTINATTHNSSNTRTDTSSETSRSENEDEHSTETKIKKSKNAEFFRLLKLFIFLNNKNWQHFSVLLLGIGRMVVLKLFNYSENESEYGVHWNFFVTLFLIWKITDLLHRFIPRKILPCLSILILLLYQFILLATPLSYFIFTAPRKNFFNSNREGIFSLFGYVPLYLLVETFSYHFFFQFENETETGIDSERSNDNENEEISEKSENVLHEIMIAGKDGNKSESVSVLSKSVSMQRKNNTEKIMESSETMIIENYSNDERRSIYDNITKNNITKNNSRNNEIGEINDHNIYEKLGNKSKRKLFFQLFIVSTVLWTAWLASTSVQQTSRRLANIAFISLVLALSFTLILFISIVDSVGDLVLVHKGCKLKNKSNKINNTNNNTSNNSNDYDINNSVNGSVICDEGSNIYNDSNHDNRNKDSLNNEDVNDECNDDLRKTSNKPVSVTHVPVRTLEYLNTMQLPVFLIANVFTGMINMSIETMYVTHLYAFFILLFYLFTVVGVSWYLISRSKNN